MPEYSFGGGPPGLAILQGVAEGINKYQLQQREKQQEAVMNRLREEQIRASEANTEVQRERERRLQEAAVEQARQMSAERRREAEQARIQAEARRQAIQQRARVLSRQYPDMAPNEILAQASGEVDNYLNQMPAPRVEDPEDPTIRENRLLDIQRKRTTQELEANKAAILGNDEILHSITSAPTLEVALKGAEGQDPIAVQEVFEITHKGIKPEEDIDFDDPAVNRKLENAAQLEAQAYIDHIQETSGGKIDPDQVATAALNLFNQKLGEIAREQARGGSVPVWEQAVTQKVKDILVQRARGEIRGPTRLKSVPWDKGHAWTSGGHEG